MPGILHQGILEAKHQDLNRKSSDLIEAEEALASATSEGERLRLQEKIDRLTAELDAITAEWEALKK